LIDAHQVKIISYTAYIIPVKSFIFCLVHLVMASLVGIQVGFGLERLATDVTHMPGSASMNQNLMVLTALDRSKLFLTKLTS
jgi:hypothetical protein